MVIKMQKITFVTSNIGKVATAQKAFADTGVELEVFAYDLIEPRSDDIKTIAEFKVMQAYNLVKQPCIALDSGFFIDALNGFPRASVNFALDTIGIQGIIKLMENAENRSCRFKECLAYNDGKEIKYFFCEHEGKIAPQIAGMDNPEKWSDLWYIYIPGDTPDNRTLAQYSAEEIKNRNGRSSFEEFVDWYVNANR